MTIAMLDEMNCFKSEQSDCYENLDYGPLVKLLKKLLPHGIPELPKIHVQLERNFREDGYIDLERFLRIVNSNRCLSDSVKKHMTKNNTDFYFEININHIFYAMEKTESLTWFDITQIDNRPMIRANFEHTLSKINPLIISKEIITEDYLKTSGIKIYIRVQKNEVNKILQNNMLVKHKTLKFWTSIHPSHYVDENQENAWVNIYFDSITAIQKGFVLFFIEGRAFCTRKDIPKKAKIFFTIPKELFNCNM